MSSIEATSVVLKGLAEARESFLALARRLGDEAHVTAVHSGIDARAYESGTCIELFVEADLDTGNLVCWWLDIRESASGWVVEPSIFVQHSAGQDAIVEFASRSIGADAEFQDVLADAVAGLTSHRERGLKAALSWKPS